MLKVVSSVTTIETQFIDANWGQNQGQMSTEFNPHPLKEGGGLLQPLKIFF